MYTFTKSNESLKQTTLYRLHKNFYTATNIKTFSYRHIFCYQSPLTRNKVQNAKKPQLAESTSCRGEIETKRDTRADYSPHPKLFNRVVMLKVTVCMGVLYL